MKACRVADDGQIDQAADDVVAEYSRLPAGRAFIDELDGLGFDDAVTSPCSAAPVILTPSSAVRQMVSTMTFPLRLHSRSLVCTDGLDTLIPTKPRTPISCATPEPPANQSMHSKTGRAYK